MSLNHNAQLEVDALRSGDYTQATGRLENSDSERSFTARAQRTKGFWEDLYKNPSEYVLRETKDA